MFKLRKKWMHFITVSALVLMQSQMPVVMGEEIQNQEQTQVGQEPSAENENSKPEIAQDQSQTDNTSEETKQEEKQESEAGDHVEVTEADQKGEQNEPEKKEDSTEEKENVNTTTPQIPNKPQASEEQKLPQIPQEMIPVEKLEGPQVIKPEEIPNLITDGVQQVIPESMLEQLQQQPLMLAVNEEPEIEYEYRDNWDEIDKVRLEDDFLDQVGMEWDDEYVYLYIKEKDTSSENSYDGSKERSFTLVTDKQSEKTITMNMYGSGQDKVDLEVQGWNGAQCIGHKMNQKYCWEVKLPISSIDDDFYKVSLKYNEKMYIEGITDLSGNHEQPETKDSELCEGGEYIDWTSLDSQNKVHKCNLNDEFLNKVGMVWDDEYIYLYVEENDSLSGQPFNGDKGRSCFTIITNPVSELTVRLRMYGSGADRVNLDLEGWKGAEGIGHKMNNGYWWEVKLPISSIYVDFHEISLKYWIGYDNNNRNYVSCFDNVTDISGNHTEQTIEDLGEFKIDGKFSDWNATGRVELSYGQYSGTKSNQGALVATDDDIIYGYFKMGDNQYYQMPLHDLHIKINDTVDVPLKIGFRDGSNHFITENTDNRPEGITDGLGIFYRENGTNDYFGEACFRVYNTNHERGDEFEYAISKDVLSRITGIPKNEMRTFYAYSPNIGQAYANGTPTGAPLGVACSIGSVALVGWLKKRKELGNE